MSNWIEIEYEEYLELGEDNEEWQVERFILDYCYPSDFKDPSEISYMEMADGEGPARYFKQRREL